MKKMLFVLVPFIINLIICINPDCTEKNFDGNKKYLSTCLNYNDESKNKELSKNVTYCCLLTMTYENKSTDTYCVSTLANTDVIEERIDMFKYQKDVKDVTIDCSSNYLIITILYIFLLMI